MSAAIDAGGPTPKQVPYGRITSFNTNATYTITIKRDEDTGALWLNSQDVRASMNPIFVYDRDVIELEVRGARDAAYYFTIQQLSGGVWADTATFNMGAFRPRRKVTLTITGDAATSTITIAETAIVPA